MAAPKPDHNFRRTAVLNKLFMRHITDMMASGEVASEILGRGIEISRVKVAPDFNKVNVFWLARGTENDEDVEKILKKSAGQLRHELSELRVMGVVPYIEFVKDKQYAKIAEVDRILETADFGEGYIPLNVGHQFKSEFTLQTLLSPEIKSHIEELEEKIPEPPLPPMRMDVLGLKHEEIMNKIKMAVKKSQAPHRHQLGVPLTSSTNSEPAWQNPEDANHDITFNLKKEEFKKFLMKRQLLQKKGLYSNSKKYSPEMDLHRSGVSEDCTITSDYLESINDDEEDYIIEDEDVSFKNE
ncbi:hypothetical protein B7P43_G10510 [Cryptotermes secundus]|nr:uncharacterized protein LOC111873623 isoform X2 [Cryptotermes secundus]PNF16398.1 hypothetical protein B7P43_G10510 [Cryptotermes secundus]